MEQSSHIATADLIRTIPLDQVPSAIALLAARLLAESTNAAHRRQHCDGSIAQEPKHLLTAGALAEHLNLPESWVRNEERVGHIPSIRAGRYVRFKLSEVENALAERKQLSPKSRSL